MIDVTPLCDDAGAGSDDQSATADLLLVVDEVLRTTRLQWSGPLEHLFDKT
jgi:hypothetical protein